MNIFMVCIVSRITCVYALLILCLLNILCMNPRIALFANTYLVIELDTLVITAVNLSLWNFLVIMLNSKQLGMAQSSTENILSYPSPYNGSSMVHKYCDQNICVSVSRCFPASEQSRGPGRPVLL